MQDVCSDLNQMSMFAELSFDSKSWSKVGGKYGIQLLDGIVQIGFLDTRRDLTTVAYFGGFEIGYFVREPDEETCFAHFQFNDLEETSSRVVTVGDAKLYDSNGRILVALHGIKTIMGNPNSSIINVQQFWQPFLAASTVAGLGTEQPEHLDCSDGILRQIIQIAKGKKEKNIFNVTLNCEGPVIVRILEIWMDDASMPNVLQSLTSAKSMVPNAIIELFIASSVPEVTQSNFKVPKSNQDWLRVRVLCLPSAQVVMRKLSFDVIALWQGSANRLWKTAHEALCELADIASPGCLLLYDDGSAKVDPDAVEVSKTWDSNAALCGIPFGEELQLERGLSSCRLRPNMEPLKSRDVLIVLSNVKVSASLQMKLDFIFGNMNCNIECLSNMEDVSHMDARIGSFISINQENPKSFLIMDGAFDTSQYGIDSFMLATKVATMVAGKLEHQDGNLATYWIVSSNTTFDPINVDHCSHTALQRNVMCRFPSLDTKFVDLEEPVDDMDALARLVAFNPSLPRFSIKSGIILTDIILRAPQNDRRLSVGPEDMDMAHSCKLFYDNRMVGKFGNHNDCDFVLFQKFVVLTNNVLNKTFRSSMISLLVQFVPQKKMKLWSGFMQHP